MEPCSLFQYLIENAITVRARVERRIVDGNREGPNVGIHTVNVPSLDTITDIGFPCGSETLTPPLVVQVMYWAPEYWEQGVVS